MRIRGLIVLAGLAVLVAATGVEAAVIKTAPFPGPQINSGNGFCAVTNAGTASGTVSKMVMYDDTGFAMDTQGPLTVAAHATAFGAAQALVSVSPTHCECTVPSSSNFRCSFIYVNSDATVTVIPGQVAP